MFGLPLHRNLLHIDSGIESHPLFIFSTDISFPWMKNIWNKFFADIACMEAMEKAGNLPSTSKYELAQLSRVINCVIEKAVPVRNGL